ncbi:MAG: MBL fold metallo-hydrolase [Desulfobacteraceae bacterium]|nr:MBL fold metallo-hydrolase [Desulfobacteraceae bacterium]
MEVRQFGYASDNLGYLVYGNRHAVAIDPGAADEMVAFADARGLAIGIVTNTHSHYDHVQGNRKMLRLTGARFQDCRTLREREFIEIGDERLLVFHTPGHMDDCLSFKADHRLITGDTLFNGTVGNCFSGDMEGFFRSIKLLTSFPGESQIYAGHDYVRQSMAFARTIDPDNPHIDAYLGKYDPGHVVSTLADEFKVNPYVRFNHPDLVAAMEKHGLPVATEYERWCSVMELY